MTTLPTILIGDNKMIEIGVIVEFRPLGDIDASLSEISYFGKIVEIDETSTSFKYKVCVTFEHHLPVLTWIKEEHIYRIL